MLRPRRQFRRTRKGIQASLEPVEAEIMAQVCRELSGLFDEDDGDEQAGKIFTRLFPRAYLDPTEEQAEAEWQRLVHDELLGGRRAALATVERTLAGAVEQRGRVEVALSEDEAAAWLSVLNDARLSLGTRLDVTEETEFSGLDPDDPATGAYVTYWWLGLLEENLVDALAS